MPVLQDADARAAAILVENLTLAERAQLGREHYVEVRGGTSGALYRVTGSASVALREDKISRWVTFCVHSLDVSPSGVWEHLPLPDRVLAMVLCIKHDEALFLERAQFHGNPLHCECYRNALRLTGARNEMLREFQRYILERSGTLRR